MVIVYLMVTLSFIFLRVRQPELERPYKIKHAKLVGAVSIGVVCFFAYLYLPMGPSPLAPIEWVLVCGWFALGLILALYARAKNRNVSPLERERLLFAEQN